MIDRGKLSSTQRSALARRVLLFLRKADPPMTEAELARSLGIARQTLHNWMWNKAAPSEQHIAPLARVLGISEAELRDDIEASRDWRPPIAFAQFVAQVEEQSARENWEDRQEILPLLHYIVNNNWQEKEGGAVELAALILAQDDMSLHKKASNLALIARGQQASGAELKPL